MARATASDEHAAESAQGLLHLLADAHAHPQLDQDHLARLAGLRVPCVAAMGVAANVDWSIMEKLAGMAGPPKIIPGFGIHPWWAHLHASELGSTWEELLEGPSPEEVARAVALLQDERQKKRREQQGDCCAAADAAGGYEAGGPQSPPEEDGGGSGKQAEKGCGCPSSMVPATSSAAARHNGVSKEEDPYDRSTGSSSSSTGSSNSISGGSNSSSAATCSDSGGPLAIVPHASWHARLRGLLSAYPHALVGEIGIDRAAVIPGSRARVRFDHQLALLREQLALAAELSRPVSIHCVRGYGHLLQLFAALPASGAGCPPAVMLHSYGGSPEDVARFCRLPGIGRRFFFSFSAAINARAPDKLVARVRAVPDDRLLVESDQVSALLVEGGMADICYIVAGAKGWGLEEAARRTLENFNAFYGTTV